ncbi:MAG: LIC_10091 family protein [Bdellovibrionota bacterium]
MIGPLFIVLHLWASVGQPAFLGDLVRALGKSAPIAGPNYVEPNEKDPAKSAPILAEAPEGAQVAVGTERGFIGFALNPRATHLILIDRDPGVVRFNRINAELLRVAKDRADYRELRIKASADEWRARGTRISPEDWKWWTSTVRNEVTSFRNLHVVDRYSRHFLGANYLEDDALFNRLHRAAVEDRIAALPIDFTDTGNLRKLSLEMKKLRLKVSTLDISNAWWKDYAGASGVESLLSALEPRMSDETILLLTLARGSEWDYFAGTIGGIRKNLPLQDLADSIEVWSNSFVAQLSRPYVGAPHGMDRFIADYSPGFREWMGIEDLLKRAVSMDRAQLADLLRRAPPGIVDALFKNGGDLLRSGKNHDKLAPVLALFEATSDDPKLRDSVLDILRAEAKESGVAGFWEQVFVKAQRDPLWMSFLVRKGNELHYWETEAGRELAARISADPGFFKLEQDQAVVSDVWYSEARRYPQRLVYRESCAGLLALERDRLIQAAQSRGR